MMWRGTWLEESPGNLMYSAYKSVTPPRKLVLVPNPGGRRMLLPTVMADGRLCLTSRPDPRTMAPPTMVTYKKFYFCCRGSHQLIKKLTLTPTFAFAFVLLLLSFENIEDEVITLAYGKTANNLRGAALAGTGISGTDDDKQCNGLNKICEGWILG